MGFIDPKRDQDEDEGLPGASGLHLDLDLKRCPVCRREVSPWETECPDCGEVAVPAADVPASTFALPALDVEDDHEGDLDPDDPDASVDGP